MDRDPINKKISLDKKRGESRDVDPQACYSSC